MTTRDTLEYLYNIGMSSQYARPISLHKNFESVPGFKIDYETISNPTGILPPSVWFTVDQAECLAKIKSDVEKSRVTKEGYLITNVLGNCLNQINYQMFEEDVGTIQDNQHCFCVPFSVLKDNCEQFLSHIQKQLRIFHLSTINQAQRSYSNGPYLDEISRFIYSKFRTFLIFDGKMHPSRVPIIQSCYYPNLHFSIEKIKAKESPKFSPNEVLTHIKEGALKNCFGYLSLDRKKRLLLMKRDEPDLDLERECFVGVWVSSTLPLRRTEKKFGKDDAIWSAVYEFYTNSELKNRIRFTDKNKGFLAYFTQVGNTPKKPEFFLFEPNNQAAIPAKWCFLSKSETLTDWKKNLEVKFDFLNTTIIEEREYSQFSQTTTNNNNNINVSDLNLPIRKENVSRENSHSGEGLEGYLSNSNVKGSNESGNHSSAEDTGLVEKLMKELEYYKKRCHELETMNKILMQQQSMNQMMHQPMYPPFAPYSMPGYPPYYPGLSHSQVSQANSEVFPVKPKSQPKKQQQPVATRYAFPPTNKDEMTFGVGKEKAEQKAQTTATMPESNTSSNTMFMKKKSSDEKEGSKKNESSEWVKESLVREIYVKPDVRNISFQDSFSEYRDNNNEGRDDEDEQQQFEQNLEDYQEGELEVDESEGNSYLANIESLKRYKSMEDEELPSWGKYESNRKKNNKNSSDEEDVANLKSPQFKRFDSLKESNEKKAIKKTQTDEKKEIEQAKPRKTVEQILKKYNQKLSSDDDDNDEDGDKQAETKPKKKLIEYKPEEERTQGAQKRSCIEYKPEEVFQDRKMDRNEERKMDRHEERKRKIVEESGSDSDEDADVKNIRRKYLLR